MLVFGFVVAFSGAFLAANKIPNFVAFNVRDWQSVDSVGEKRLAPLADFDKQVENRVAVRASQSFDASHGTALNDHLQDHLGAVDVQTKIAEQAGMAGKSFAARFAAESGRFLCGQCQIE